MRSSRFMRNNVPIWACAATVSVIAQNAKTIEKETPTDQESDGTGRPDETDSHARRATGRVTETLTDQETKSRVQEAMRPKPRMSAVDVARNVNLRCEKYQTRQTDIHRGGQFE